MLFVVAALADRRHIRDIPRFANVATAEMIVVRRYVWSTNALMLCQGRFFVSGRSSPRLAALALLDVSLDMPSSRRLASHDDHAPRPEDSTLTEHQRRAPKVQ